MFRSTGEGRNGNDFLTSVWSFRLEFNRSHKTSNNWHVTWTVFCFCRKFLVNFWIHIISKRSDLQLQCVGKPDFQGLKKIIYSQRYSWGQVTFRVRASIVNDEGLLTFVQEFGCFLRNLTSKRFHTEKSFGNVLYV